MVFYMLTTFFSLSNNPCNDKLQVLISDDPSEATHIGLSAIKLDEMPLIENVIYGRCSGNNDSYPLTFIALK